VAVASAGPYANHFCTSLQTDNHASTSLINSAECSSWYPTNSVKAVTKVRDIC